MAGVRRWVLLAAVVWCPVVPASAEEAASGAEELSATTSAATTENNLQALSVRGISSEPGDDDPRVLYIMPWQAPTIPRRPRTELNAQSPGLLEPLDPVVFERHRQFRQTLDPEMDSSLSLQ